MQEWEQESPQTCDQAIIRLSNPIPRPGEQYSPRPDVKGHRPRQHQNEMVETCDCDLHPCGNVGRGVTLRAPASHIPTRMESRDRIFYRQSIQPIFNYTDY